MRFPALILTLLAPLALIGAAPEPQGAPIPGMVRVRIVTAEGNIVIALDARRAPRTTRNFLAYVDDGRFEGTWFYRTARRTGDPKRGFIQGGIASDARRMLDRLPLEPTSQTGLKHLDGTLSMAHGPDPNSANGNFSIMVGPNPSLDAKPGFAGFAAFGQVISGMDVVKRILAKPSGGGDGVMRGQILHQPVQIVRAERLDGVARPSTSFKPWLIRVR